MIALIFWRAPLAGGSERDLEDSHPKKYGRNRQPVLWSSTKMNDSALPAQARFQVLLPEATACTRLRREILQRDG